MSQRLAAFLLVLVAATPIAASAQTTVTGVVNFLMTNQAVPTGDFARDQEASRIAAETITRALVINLASVPIASSSSGFLYRLNPQLGTVERVTDSFGNFFIERALTPGHGRATFGISASSSSFERLDGQSLDDGTLLTIANRFRDEPEPFDTESLTLRVTSSTMTLYGSVGVTDRFEIGGVVPFVRLSLEGQRVNVYRGESLLQASGSATASGIADIAVRAKYTVVSGRQGGAAIAAELRLPTGNADNLLGAGTRAFRILAIGAAEHGAVTLSGNAAFVQGGVSDELNFGGAAAIAVHHRLSITGEVLARHLSELRPIQLSSQPHPNFAGVETVRLIGGDPGRMVAGAVAGIKWNPGSTVVIGAHLRWSLTNTGLTAPITPSVALEYGF